MISRQPIPTFWVRGEVNRFTLDFRTDAGVSSTIVSAKYTIYAGSRVIVAETAATVAGGVAYFDITPAETETPASNWLIVWSDIVVGATTYQGVRVHVILVLQALYCPITDTDLTDEHPHLSRVMPTGETTWEKFRTGAFNRMIRKMKRKGLVAAFIMDVDATVEFLVYSTLHRIFLEGVHTMGDRTYKELAEDYRKQASDAWNDMVARYDKNATGKIDGYGFMSGEELAVEASQIWTQPPGRSKRGRV